MINRKLYEEQKNSIYQLQKKMNLSKDCLYKYARKEIDINKMPIDIMLGIAYIEKIEPNRLYEEMKKYLEKGETNDK